MAISVGMHEAKTTLSRLVDAARAGEEVVITRSGEPVARIEPIRPTVARRSLFGSLEGQIEIAEDFDELPEELLAAFEGGHDDLLC
jgi:prevent-host-death family protein